MVSIARKNLFHDKIRFIITLIGVTFSVVLIFAQVGIYLGFMQNASIVIDNTDADIWITSRNTPNFDWAQAFPETKINLVRETKGILHAEKFILAWGMMKRKEGGTEQVEIIGYNPDSGMGGPWNMREGKASDVKGGKYIIVDESAKKKIGEFNIGDEREVMNQKVKVIGMTTGIKSFTTAPFIFASYNTAKSLASYIRADNTVFILAKTEPAEDVHEIVQRLKERLKGVDVYTSRQFSNRTRWYWTVETGMGMGFLMTAFMGFAIGIVIVGQTIYTSTIEHLREYGTLKAIGANNFFIYKIIFEQAIVNAVIGYIVGLVITQFLIKGYEKTGLAMIIPNYLIVTVFFLTILMCIFASFISIRKATKIDPAIVFKV